MRDRSRAEIRAAGLAAVLLIAMLGSGCSKAEKVAQCEALPSLDAMKPPSDFGASPSESIMRAQACIHYLGYRYAKVDADPRVLADAVIAACDTPVSSAQLNSWLASFNAHNEGGLPPGFQALAADGSEGSPCVKGSSCESKTWDERAVVAEADRKGREVVGDLRGQALYRVIEAKAGGCSAPALVKSRAP